MPPARLWHPGTSPALKVSWGKGTGLPGGGIPCPWKMPSSRGPCRTKLGLPGPGPTQTCWLNLWSLFEAAPAISRVSLRLYSGHFCTGLALLALDSAPGRKGLASPSLYPSISHSACSWWVGEWMAGVAVRVWCSVDSPWLLPHAASRRMGGALFPRACFETASPPGPRLGSLDAGHRGSVGKVQPVTSALPQAAQS